jgi:phospholipid/cholesterol/gamma-HCH transport system permease protein
MNTDKAQFLYDKNQNHFQCIGRWTTVHVGYLLENLKTQPWPFNQSLTIDAATLTAFDSAGALCLIECINRLKMSQNSTEIVGLTSQQSELITMVESNKEAMKYQRLSKIKPGFLYQLGKETVYKWFQIDGLVILIGDLTEKVWSSLTQWKRFRSASIISNIYSTGIKALPILALLSFLIGVVLAYQMGLQLETYGANIFIAYLSGMAIFREFGPLITAIIVAGRTSSAFTAQIGSMKINEEIDALHTMGLSPTELLVLPKTIALVFVFPLLIFWSDFWGSLGAMMMAKYMLNIGYYDFLHRLQDSVGLKQLMLGLYKAPAFAVLIALVGCFQGFQVGTSADSVGAQTTKSVVQALFLIIIADATYSIIYSWLDL